MTEEEQRQFNILKSKHESCLEVIKTTKEAFTVVIELFGINADSIEFLKKLDDALIELK